MAKLNWRRCLCAVGIHRLQDEESNNLEDVKLNCHMHRIHNLSSKTLVVHYPTPEFNRWGRVVIEPGAVIPCPSGQLLPSGQRELAMLWEGPDIYLRCGDEPYVAPKDAKVCPPGVHFEGIYFFVNGGTP